MHHAPRVRKHEIVHQGTVGEHCLGADAGGIMRLILAGAGRLLAAGMAVGIGMTFVAERTLKSALFGVSPLDPWTLLGAVVLLAAVMLLAASFPARRAAAVDPLDAIRAE